MSSPDEVEGKAKHAVTIGTSLLMEWVFRLLERGEQPDRDTDFNDRMYRKVVRAAYSVFSLLFEWKFRRKPPSPRAVFDIPE